MSAQAASAPASAESDVELMRTILGEHVPQSVILTCLNACAFDVSAALNWYFAEVAAAPAADASTPQRPEAADAVPSIQSGLSLTLHPRAMEGMVSKSEAYYATLTRGDPAYDMLTPSNDKFLTVRLRKRGWRTGTFLGPATRRPFLANGDVVTLECNGLWLRASSLNKMLQWKAPAEDERNKFVIRGLPLGKSLAPGDYFFLTSFKWKDKEIVRRDERPVGISSYNTNVHRCFLGLERIKTANQRLYLYAKLTPNAIKSLPRPDDPIDVNHLTISVMGTPMSTGSISLREQNHTRRKDSISDEIQLTNTKIEQMANIIGTDVSRDRLANFLDGAGGDVQVALEHYFMSVSTPPQGATSTSAPPTIQIPVRDSSTSFEEAQARAHAEAQANHDRRPLSQLILGIPSMAEPLPYGKAYDWWSLGIVIYEMLVGESPFYDENEHKMLSRIAYSDVVFPSDFPRDAYDLVKGLLCKDPKQRLGSERTGGVDAIKRCRFFRHIDWDKLLRREVKAHWTPKLSGETDTRYVDPEFIDEGPPSAAYDPSAETSSSLSKRFSQFSFNYNLG
ncbi:hypothetical protein PF001_g21352 [Phytophthora fragariae]|uniref:AGC-kinase C-terminal domain-containing protein n=1 Tax=Phytophthora fragariae TaxID=53985 RepID=A0A6A4CGZ8_9STRA|nr:hypothetical protein PF004_g20417 [Phytophthora fragariae]KAE9286626.1 hypothetical protein PF001_g21352 [Phytophthora fragariae]